jgi:hypothetical protein
MPENTQPLETWAIVEEWRAVVGFEDLYEISDAGRVRRVGRAARKGNGRGGGARVGRVLTQHTRVAGYRSVQLWREGHYANRLVHCLVAEAFIGSRPTDHDVNHIDGIKGNNARSNLEYLTRAANNRHAYDTGLRAGFSGRPRWA